MMRAASHDAKAMKTIAAIRGLQVRAARLASARADGERRKAEHRLEEGRAAVRAAESGWAAAVEGARFDPALSCSWFHALETYRSEERQLGETAAQAEREAGLRRRALQEAQARSDASEAEARSAARTVTRRRDEARLAAVEDQLNARRGQS
jgi:hypothetical protein